MKRQGRCSIPNVRKSFIAHLSTIRQLANSLTLTHPPPHTRHRHNQFLRLHRLRNVRLVPRHPRPHPILRPRKRRQPTPRSQGTSLTSRTKPPPPRPAIAIPLMIKSGDSDLRSPGPAAAESASSTSA